MGSKIETLRLKRAERDSHTLSAVRALCELHKADAARIMNGQYTVEAKAVNMGLHAGYRAVLQWIDDLTRKHNGE